MPMQHPRIYTLNGQHARWDPADAEVGYFGAYGHLGPSVATSRKLYIPRRGVITEVLYIFHAFGEVGTAEAINLKLRVMNTTDYNVETNTSAGEIRLFSNVAMNVPVGAGEYVELKCTCPTWVTNPANVLGQFVIVVVSP